MVPDGSGKIVVTLTQSASYNYLNGFILSENSSTTTHNTRNNTNGVIPEQAGALQVQAFPNPSSHYFTLRVMGTTNRPGQLHITDALGRVVETRNAVPANTTLTIGAAYRPGVYYAQWMLGGTKQVLKLVKTTAE